MVAEGEHVRAVGWLAVDQQLSTGRLNEQAWRNRPDLETAAAVIKEATRHIL
jgi:hypothetical protein